MELIKDRKTDNRRSQWLSYVRNRLQMTEASCARGGICCQWNILFLNFKKAEAPHLLKIKYRSSFNSISR